MDKLLRSRKFWAAVWAAVVNVVTFVAASYFPEKQDLITVCMVSLDGVLAVVIASIAYEDGQAYKAGAHPNQRAE